MSDMAGRGVLGRVRRVLAWLFAEGDIGTEGRCPICRRRVKTMPNHMGGKSAAFPIPRPVGELVTACREQHGTHHSEEEVRAATLERPWR